MSLVVGLIALLLACNYWVGRSLLYPPAMFALVWTGTLLLLATSGGLFYHVGIDTLLFYLWGACAFSIGGVIAWFSPISLEGNTNAGRVERTASREFAIQRLLNGLLVALFLIFPVYIRWLLQLASESSDLDFLWAVQVQLRAYKDNEGVSHVSILDNCAVLSILLALVCHIESDGSRRRKLRTSAAVLLALVYNLIRGERAATVILLIGLLIISWLRSGKINWKQLAVVAALFIFAFSFVGIALEKGYVRNNASLVENIRPLVESFQLYEAGSAVAFDHVFHDPQKVPAVWKWNRVFLQAANKLGGNYDLPSLNAEYVDIGPELYMNTYTIYFAYFPDFGLVGTSLMMVVLGCAVTMVYTVARQGGPQSVVLFALLLSGVVLSEFGEHFFLELNFLTKAMLFTFVVYKWRGLEKLPGLAQRRSSKSLALQAS